MTFAAVICDADDPCSVIDEARTSGAKEHFASLMDICHLKMLNWRQRTKNTKVELFSEVIL